MAYPENLSQLYSSGSPSSMSSTTSSTGNLESMFSKLSSQQLSANKKRKAQIEGIYDEVIARYGPGGTFGKSYLQQLESQKVRDVGAGTQNLISSGMYGTTTTAGLPGKWEAETGAPARLKLEDLMMERLSTAQLGKASFLENIQEPYPDYAALMSASAAAGSSGGGSSGGGGTSTISGGGDVGNDWYRWSSDALGGGSTGGSSGGGTSSTPSGGTSRPVTLSQGLLESSEVYKLHQALAAAQNSLSDVQSGAGPYGKMSANNKNYLIKTLNENITELQVKLQGMK